jgi:hypothetical protein
MSVRNQHSLEGVLQHFLLRSGARFVARKTDTLQEDTGSMWARAYLEHDSPTFVGANDGENKCCIEK